MLSRHHIITINDTSVVTWGHSFTEGILAHEFFGSSRVVEKLKQCAGFDEGCVELTTSIRDL